MKILFIINFILLTGYTCLAQAPDKVLAKVRYTFLHITDTTQKDKPRNENMLLLIGKNASLFTSYDKIMQGISMQKQIEEQIKNNAGVLQNININKTGLKPTTQIDYYFFAKENKFYTKERLFNNYLVEEQAPKIDWKITSDTLTLSGVSCQKAVTFFKGRNWIAWFAPEMPFLSGPWKLNGLPGLIIEAYDEKKEVQFIFAGIEDTLAPPEDKAENVVSSSAMNVKIVGIDNSFSFKEIRLPADALKTSRKELDKLKEARDKDPQGFINTQMAASGMSGTIKTTSVLKTSSQNKSVFNNPIELPVK